MEIGFASSDVPLDARPEVDGVLSGIRWPSDPPLRLSVRRQLTGGRSGARVLQVDVERSRDRVDRRVIKIDRAGALAGEWRAYTQYLRGRQQAPLTPIEAASGFIQGDDFGQGDEPGPEADRAAAIVYVEVTAYAGLNDPAATLEDVAGAAVRTGDARQAVALTSLLMRQAAALHRPVTADTLRTLRQLNPQMGVDLVLEVDRASPTGGLAYQNPLESQLAARRRYPADVLAVSTSPDGTGQPTNSPIAKGDVILLEGVVPRAIAGDGLIADFLEGGVTIGIRPAAEGADPGIISRRLLRHPMTVVGRVAEVRTDARCQLVRHLLPGSSLDDETVILDGSSMCHPFARLHGLLTEEVRGRVKVELSHGDLNPRNVLIVAGQVYLIDFAKTAPGGSPSFDAAWLETCLMRDVFAPALPTADLARLQRLLGAATRAVCAGETVGGEVSALLPEGSPTRAAFDMLWAIRVAASRERPAGARPLQGDDLPWWRDYLGQLTLAACATLKWPAGDQSADQVRAAVVLASVAAEWLGPRPYSFWHIEDLRSLVPRLAPALGAGDPQDSAAILAALVDAVRRVAIPDADLPAGVPGAVAAWQELERARSRLVAEVFREQAMAAADALREEHDVFIAVTSFIHLDAVSEDWPSYPQAWPGRLDPFDYPATASALAFDPYTQPPGTLAFPGLSDAPGSVPSAAPVAHLQLARTGPPGGEPSSLPQDAETDPEPAQLYGYGTADAERDGATAGTVMDLIAGLYEVVLVGAAGSGKSTVARELQYRLAHAVAGKAQEGRSRPQRLPALMPILVRGRDIDRILHEHERSGADRPLPPGEVLRAVTSVRGVSDSMLAIGAVHVTVDAFNEVTDDAKKRVARWVRRLRRSFPFVPVMFCYRRFDFERNPLHYPLVSLQNVTEGQAREYINDVLRLRELPDAQDRVASLASMLLDNPENAQVRDLAQRPLFLWMIVERYADEEALPDNIGALMADFSQWFVEERHRRNRPGESEPEYVFSYADKVRVLEAFGVHLVEHGHGETDLSTDDAERVLAGLAEGGVAEGGLEDPHGVLAEIVASELLYATETGFSFYHQSFQEYFAARVFESEAGDEAKLRERTLSFDGRESMRMMLGYSGGRPDLARQVVRVALQANPLDAAELLRACETPPPEAIAEFLQAQTAVLADTGTGQAAWASAAEALGRYRSPDALAVLHATALASGAAVDARLAALRVLLQAEDRKALKGTVGALMGEDTPLELREAAVRGVGTCRLSLLIQVSGLIADGTPWPIMRAAHDVLQQSKEQLTPALDQAYMRACEARLPVLEQDLCRLVPISDWHDLQAERVELLGVLARASRTDLVLARRFSYGIAENDRWEEWLRPESLPAAPRIPPAALQALTGGLGPEGLLGLFSASTDPLEISAAGHALLRLGDPGICVQILDSVTADSLPGQLLVVAAAAAGFDEDPDGRVEALIRGLIDRLGATSTEPLAALLETYPGPGLRRNVLLYKGDFTAAEKGLDPVLRRPLGVEWLRSQALAYDQIDEFLRGTDEEVAAAVGALYGRSGALNWFVMEDRELSGEARQKFVSYVVDSDHTALEMSSIAAAGASIKAYEIIGSLLPLLDDEWITRPQTLVNGSQGAIEGGSRLIIVLPALGYLGRVAHSAGEHAKAATVLDRLTSYRVKDGQEADEMARRTALAYLGLWKPLLQGLPERGTLWHKVAVNCVSYDWLPGPYTPRDEEGKEYIARWIAQELARPDSGYGPAVRSTLAEIKDGLEKELRQRIVVGYGPA